MDTNRFVVRALGIAMAAAVGLPVAPASAALRGPSATFDDLPVGTAVSTQYAPALTFGVDLLGHPAGVFPVVTRPHSGGRVGRADPETQPFHGAPPLPPAVWGRLGVPASGLSVQVGTFGPHRAYVTLDAYDGSGHLVAHATRTVSTGFKNQLRVTAPRAVITTFRIAGTSLAPLSIDNLRPSR